MKQKNSEKGVFFEKSNKPTLSKSDSERENKSAVIGNAMDINSHKNGKDWKKLDDVQVHGHKTKI